MNRLFLILLFFISLLVACTGDPPLLTTPLPNGYAFDSNGGWYGYIKAADGKRMADHFGLLDDGTEAWCEEFAWENNIVVCNLHETQTINKKELKTIRFFVIDTSTAQIKKYDTVEEANIFWKERFGNSLPAMKTKYQTTKRK